MTQPAFSNSTEKPMWQPTDDQKNGSLLRSFMQKIDATGNNYASLHQWSLDNTEDFWSLVWDDAGVIGDKGNKPYLLDADKMPGAKFFPTSSLNYAENLLRRCDNTLAMIFRSEGDFVRKTMTWETLHEKVSQFQQGLKKLGIGKGDRVCGYMPNMMETIVAMLATTSLGAIWSSASPDFGKQGVLDRFGQIEPKVMIAAEGYYYNGKVIDCLEKLSDIIPSLPSLEKVIVVDYVRQSENMDVLGDKVVRYDDFLSDHESKDVEFERVEFNHPLFIMFSSGTTGIPKCIVHGTGGTLLQHLKEHRLHCNTKPSDRVFYFTTCGWMMWNWLVTALACEATLMLYDGSPFYPDGNVLWNYAEEEQFVFFGTSAKYIDALKKQGYEPVKTHDLSTVNVLASTGSPLVPESFDYIYSGIKKDLHVASISGGTDIVSCFVLGNPMSPVWRGEIQCAGLGMAVEVFDDHGKSIDEGQGELVCTKPFPSMPVSFWNDPDGKKYQGAYFESYDNIWCHGDWVEKTNHGGFIIHGRSDATLNPGGVRIGTAEIYRQVEQLNEVIESIAVGHDIGGDVEVVLFVILKDGLSLHDDLIKMIKTKVRTGATPRHVPAKIYQVTDIPRTKSGKITEIAVRHVIHGRDVKNKEALANPESLEQFKNRIEG